MNRVFLFLLTILTFFCLSFLVQSYRAKPVTAAGACTLLSKSVAPGETIGISHGGFAAGESIRLFGISVQTGLTTTIDSTTALQTQNVQIPVIVAEDDYNILIVTRFPVTSTTCNGGPLRVTTSASTAGTGTCAGFFDCLSGITSPTNRYSENGLVGTLISDILPLALVFIGFIVVIMIVISGIQFITSSGNPEGAAGARSRLIYAIIGLAITILAFAITQIIDKIFLGGSGAV